LVSGEIRRRMIDICEDRYRMLRSELMKNAREASEWIRTYFLVHPDVTVSCPEHFVELLKKWMTDPCVERSGKLESTVA